MGLTGTRDDPNGNDPSQLLLILGLAITVIVIPSTMLPAGFFKVTVLEGSGWISVGWAREENLEPRAFTGKIFYI